MLIAKGRQANEKGRNWDRIFFSKIKEMVIMREKAKIVIDIRGMSEKYRKVLNRFDKLDLKNI